MARPRASPHRLLNLICDSRSSAYSLWVGRRYAVWLCSKCMRSRKQIIGPLLRSIAAVTLLFWIGAVALCSVHCTSGINHGDSAQAACHGSAVSQAQHHDHDSPAPAHNDSSTATCLTLKSALSDGNALVYFPPAFPLFYTLTPLAFAWDSAVTEPTTLVFRQARLSEWVLTPEVCLGPAFRSLAPPSSSLA